MLFITVVIIQETMTCNVSIISQDMDIDCDLQPLPRLGSLVLLIPKRFLTNSENTMNWNTMIVSMDS